MSGRETPSLRRVAAGSLSNAVYFAVQSVVFLALTPLTLKALGAEVYGLWTIMLALLGFSNLAQLGIDTAVAKYTAQFSVNADSGHDFSAAITFSYLMVMVTGSVVCLALWLARFPLAARLDVSQELKPILPAVFGLVALGIIPGFLFSVSRGILLGLLRNTAVNTIDVTTNVASWVGALAVGLSAGNILILAWLVVAVNLIRLVWGTVMALRAVRPFHLRVLLDEAVSRQVLQFSVVAWVSSFGSILYQSTDRLLVGLALGPSVAATYGIATSVGARLTGLTSRVTQTLMPYSSALSQGGEIRRVSVIFRHSNRLITGVSLAMGGCAVIWMPQILSVWISPTFSAENTFLFQMIVIAYTIASLALPGQQIAQGLAWLATPAVLYLGSGLLLNVAIWSLAPALGIAGVMLANFVTVLLLLVPMRLGRLLGVRIIETIADLGIPLISFSTLVAIVVLHPTSAARVLASLLLAASMVLLSLSGRRFQLISAALKNT